MVNPSSRSAPLINRICFTWAMPWRSRGSSVPLKTSPVTAACAATVSADQALAALTQVGLRARAHLPLRVLSQGQQRRAALARLVVSQATLWVLDEPWVALDAASVTLLSEQLDAHVRRGGALLFTSHQAAPLATAGQTVSLQA